MGDRQRPADGDAVGSMTLPLDERERLARCTVARCGMPFRPDAGECEGGHFMTYDDRQRVALVAELRRLRAIEAAARAYVDMPLSSFAMDHVNALAALRAALEVKP